MGIEVPESILHPNPLKKTKQKKTKLSFPPLCLQDTAHRHRAPQTGGQDDLCTVYAPLEQHVVAHCQGHASWVKGVAWDAWRSEDRTLRFASVGEINPEGLGASPGAFVRS